MKSLSLFGFPLLYLIPLLVPSSSARAQSFLDAAKSQAVDAKTQLPANPAAWLNSPPLTTEMLAGKSAFLYFYEEGCPRCRERWPAIFEAANQFQGKPVVFIAVNSGTPRNEVQRYASEVGLKWPVIVDTDRSFEKAAGLTNEISLQNIYQARALLPDGSIQNASTDIASSVPELLTDAKWRVEPTEVPDLLKPAWLQIEFGNFNAASALIKKNLSSPKSDVKSGAEKLMAAVTKERDAAIKAADEADAAGRKWEAFKLYTALVLRFKTFDVPTEIHVKLRELPTTEAVRNELAAGKLWDGVARQLSPAAPPSKGALAQLQRIVKQHPDTEAARHAQLVIDRAAVASQ
ncbi:MAG: hypothetical protein C0483_12500 [Pirellula sp.]|nr:hypothetical protein [Pirellula sp.]